jgi:ATP synthase protein I
MVRALFERRTATQKALEAGVGSMADDDPDEKRLAELGRRLQKARGNVELRPQQGSQSQMGIAFRLVADLLAGVIVGGGIGWALDRVFETSPILLIVMFLLGVAAGMRNLMRTARDLNQRQDRSGG